MKNIGRIMEHFWLAMAIATSILAVYAIAHYGSQEGRKWLWFPLITSAMWMFRRFTGRKLKAMEDRRRSREGH